MSTKQDFPMQLYTHGEKSFEIGDDLEYGLDVEVESLQDDEEQKSIQEDQYFSKRNRNQILATLTAISCGELVLVIWETPVCKILHEVLSWATASNTVETSRFASSAWGRVGVATMPLTAVARRSKSGAKRRTMVAGKRVKEVYRVGG